MEWAILKGVLDQKLILGVFFFGSTSSILKVVVELEGVCFI
jgi:hypothetical protein